jgi:aromatic-amino-acid transaminase
MAPRDPILGLNEQFAADPNPNKVNLGVGVYYDENGKLPLLKCVAAAEQQLVEAAKPRGYLPIDGIAAYDQAVQGLVFGADSAVVRDKRVATVQALGGTGGLKVGADFLRQLRPQARVLISDPSWENHRALFTGPASRSAATPTTTALRDAGGVDFAGMLAALHGGTCRHRRGAACLLPQPHRLRPDARAMGRGGGAGACARSGALPRHGLPGLRRRAWPRTAPRWPVHRVGHGLLRVHFVLEELLALRRARRRAVSGVRQQGRGGPRAVAAQDRDPHQLFQSANPRRPVVATVLSTPALRAQWEDELAGMRARIKTMRGELVARLKAAGVGQDMSFIARQQGMFSYSGLSAAQMQRLRSEFGVYGVDSGRICVAALNSNNIDAVVAAIAKVL